MIDKLRTALAGSSFVRNVVTLMTGTLLAQIITIIVAPILTRIYSPADYGALALYSSIISILAVISCGRYEIAIVIPDKEEEACSLFVLSLILGAIIGLVLFVVMLVCRRWIPIWFPSQISNNIWIWLIPINVILMSLFQTLTYWNIRSKEYRRLAKRQVNQSISTATSQIFLAIFKLGERGLIFGNFIGQFIATSVLFWQTGKKNWADIRKEANKKSIYCVMHKFRKFPLYDSWPSLLDSLTLAMPILFFTYFYGTSESGQLALTLKILAIPSALIGASVSQVYFQKLAAAKNEGLKLSAIVEPTFIGLLGIGISFCLAVVFLAPPLFPIIFGSNWVVSGKFAKILAPALALRFIVSPLSSAFAVLNRLELIAIWKVIAATCTAAALLISTYFNNPNTSVLFLMINDLLIYSLYLALIFKISNSSIIHSITYSYKEINRFIHYKK
jgi:O-antigen/teichoic acid export membrane protein